MYALIAAHLANVIFNWSEMEFPALRLIAFLLLAAVDTGVAVYYRYVAAVSSSSDRHRKQRPDLLNTQNMR